MSEAKQSPSWIFFEEKDETFIHKENLKTKTHRGYGDLLAVKRFNLKAKFADTNLNNKLLYSS